MHRRPEICPDGRFRWGLGRGGGVRLSVAPPPPPRSVEFRAEIGSLPARDRFASAPRSGRGVRRASLPPGKWCFRTPLAPRSSDLHHIWRRTGRLRVLEGALQPAPTVRAHLPGAPYGPPLLRNSRRVTDPGAVIGVGQGPGDWRGFAVRTGRRGEVKAREGTRLPGRGLRVGTASGRPPGGRNVNVPFQHQRTFLPSY